MEQVQIRAVGVPYICTLFVPHNFSLCSASRLLVWNFMPTIIGYFECLPGRISKIVPFFKLSY